MNQQLAFDALLSGFAQEQKLPSSFIDTAKQWYLPLLDSLATKVSQGAVSVIGVSGSQGSGKSTLAALLEQSLKQQFGLNAVSLSLDDFYLTHNERQTLGANTHPLLKTRGVPGTHDIPLAIKTIQNLLKPGRTSVPRFNKATDDRKAEAEWDTHESPVDVIILEGWCLALPPQADSELIEPINELEQSQDKNKQWRKFVNDALATSYPALFKLVDFLIYLKAPDFQSVFRWRTQQEEKLIEKISKKDVPETNQKGIMDNAALNQFMQHYQRLTLHGFKVLPNLADVTFLLSPQQSIVEKIEKS